MFKVPRKIDLFGVYNRATFENKTAFVFLELL